MLSNIDRFADTICANTRSLHPEDIRELQDMHNVNNCDECDNWFDADNDDGLTIIEAYQLFEDVE